MIDFVKMENEVKFIYWPVSFIPFIDSTALTVILKILSAFIIQSFSMSELRYKSNWIALARYDNSQSRSIWFVLI